MNKTNNYIKVGGTPVAFFDDTDRIARRMVLELAQDARTEAIRKQRRNMPSDSGKPVRTPNITTYIYVPGMAVDGYTEWTAK